MVPGDGTNLGASKELALYFHSWLARQWFWDRDVGHASDGVTQSEEVLGQQGARGELATVAEQQVLSHSAGHIGRNAVHNLP
jgi:hypothetical protein